MGKCSIDSMNPIARRRRKSHRRQTTLILMRRKIRMRRTARRVYVEDMCCIHGIDWKLSLSCPKNYCNTIVFTVCLRFNRRCLAHVMKIPRLGVLFDIVRHRSEWDRNGSEMWNVYMQIYITDKSLQHHDNIPISGPGKFTAWYSTTQQLQDMRVDLSPCVDVLTPNMDL